MSVCSAIGGQLRQARAGVLDAQGRDGRHGRVADGARTTTARIAASLGRRASAAGWLGRGGIGRQSPMIASRPEGLAQSASSLKAMTRADVDTSDRLAASAIAAASLGPAQPEVGVEDSSREGQGGVRR